MPQLKNTFKEAIYLQPINSETKRDETTKKTVAPSFARLKKD